MLYCNCYKNSVEMDKPMTGKLMDIVSQLFKGDQKSEPEQDEFVYDKNVPAIEDQIAEIMNDVPQEDFDMLPDDLIDNLDHYLYGHPKK